MKKIFIAVLILSLAVNLHAQTFTQYTTTEQQSWQTKGKVKLAPHTAPEGAAGSPMKRINFSEQKHGAVVHVTKKELKRLIKFWKKK